MQYILLVDKTVGQEALKAKAAKPGADGTLSTIAELLVESDQDELGIEALRYVRIDDNDTDDIGLLTTQDYRAAAIEPVCS